MRFDLTDEQKMLRDNLEVLFAAEINANRLAVAESDEIDALRAQLDTRLAAMGVPAALAAETHGGLRLGLLTLAVAAEAAGRHAAPTTAILSAIGAWLIGESASDDQRTEWLPALLSGEAKAALAIGGPTAAHMREGKLEGAAMDVEAAEEAAVFIVRCADGSLALAPKSAAIAMTTAKPLDQTRPTSVVRFDCAAAVRLDASEDLRARLRDALLIVLAADSYGAGTRAFDITLEYAKTRHQFGRPIGANQGMKHQLANMCVAFAPSRFLAWHAAHAWDAMPDLAAHAAALAKAHVPSAAVTLARGAVEGHGAIGYTWEYPLHIFLKRAMYDRAAFGGAAHHRARAAALAGW